MEYLRRKLGAVGLSLAMALSASIGICGNFYVATNGNDTWSGLLPAPNSDGTDGPFATLEAAQNAIRLLESGSGLPAGGVKVNLRGGRYMRQTPFTLGVNWSPVAVYDSGTPASPIVYQAYPGETPIIVGGMSVTGFQAVTDPNILARLTSAAQTNVLVANLPIQGITNIMPLARHGFALWWNWSGQNELYFQDKPMQLARWPNTNWLNIASSPSPGANSFGYNGSNPSTWASLDDVWVQGYWDTDWADEFDNVSSIDTTNHIVYMTSPASQLGYAVNQRFYFLNVLEELDAPGEYYIDRVNGFLYFWPPGDIASGNPFISMAGSGLYGLTVNNGADGLVNLLSVSNVVFSGITFEGAAGSLICIEYGQNNLITNCTLNGGSCDGVDLVNTFMSGVAYCTIANTGENGVFMLDGDINDRMTLTSIADFAIDNTIYNMGRLCWTYTPGIYIAGSVGDYAAHNLIYNGRHDAIVVGGNNNVVEFNEIHNVCTETADAGAIYMLRDWTQRGNIIRYNYLHDINLGGGAADPNGVVGVYLDDLFCGTTIYENIFSAVDHGVFIGGGRDNIVQNNIFVGCADWAIKVDQRGLDWESGFITDNNSVMWAELYAMPYQTPPWSLEYPALVSIATNNPGAALGNIIQDNISCNNAVWINWLNGAQNNVTETNNFTSGDPLFVNCSQPQFGLLPNSPVWALGFQPIPASGIGPMPLPPTGMWILGPP
jgi:hypothetical protein